MPPRPKQHDGPAPIIAVRLDRPVYDRLNDLAAETSTDRSALIRQIVTDYITAQFKG